MSAIERLNACEILDSRGKPTVKATCALASGATASASVPSGASTGRAEACELRDGDPGRYRGLGCRKAAANVAGPIFDALRGREIRDQAALDAMLLELDGTADKSRLGANALLAVSIAFARAVSVERSIPLYQHLSDIAASRLRALPRPTINLFSGGKHAGGQVPIQDVLVVPRAATIDQCLAMTWSIFQAAAELAKAKYKVRPLRADEGGLAPPFPSIESMFDDAVTSIRDAGFEPGRDVALAIDVASSHFFHEGGYVIDNRRLDSSAMIARVDGWVRNWPIVSVEDALSEEDWAHWPRLRETIGGRALVLGDDFLCTNPDRIRRAIASAAANALLLKVNQIGTLTEAANARELARSVGWHVTISARSGENEDDWLADLAVGWAGDQIKVGSITQSERLAKYNRLLEIEAETKLPVTNWP
jgi:enolase